MKKRLTQKDLTQMVANALPAAYADDLPAIRQALNDTADGWRKDGYTVPDFDQPRMVKAVRAGLRKRALAAAGIDDNLRRSGII